MLRKFFLPSMYALVCVLFIVNCVREIDFEDDKADRNAFVISGSFTNNSGPHRLQFVRPDNYYESKFYRGIRGALIELHDDLGNVYPYREVVYFDKREYWLENVTGVVGRTYWLEINYRDTLIRSRPEKMLEPLLSDEIIFESRMVEQLGEFGSVTLQPTSYVYASSVIPDNADGRCIRWEAEYVYIMDDRPCPPLFGPPSNQQCFISTLLGGKTLGIENPNRFQPGTLIKTLCGERGVDVAFSSRCAINLYKRTISLDAYNYWVKVQQLLNPGGTVFDAPPGKIYGNLDIVTDHKADIFGWFEVSSTSTSRAYKTRANLDYETASFANNPCFSGNGACATSGICFDCLDQPYSTLEKPDWWQ